MKKHLAIIDYGMGNLHSVASAFQHISPDTHVTISANEQDILNADHVILPGVGAIRDCMQSIRDAHVDQMVSKVIEQQQPLLGICVGMQVLMAFSEENQGIEGLSHFDGKVKLFPKQAKDNDAPIKVPHMGWNNVKQTDDHPIWQGIADDTRFYFVHSYYVETDREHTIGSCHYGVPFSAVLAKDNLVAVQFHPEKSHVAGLKLLRNFLNWSGQ